MGSRTYSVKVERTQVHHATIEVDVDSGGLTDAEDEQEWLDAATEAAKRKADGDEGIDWGIVESEDFDIVGGEEPEEVARD